MDNILGNINIPNGFVPIQGEIVCHDNGKLCVSINLDDWKTACDKHIPIRKERDIFPTIPVDPRGAIKKSIKKGGCTCVYPKPKNQPCDKDCQCSMNPEIKYTHKASQCEETEDSYRKCLCDVETINKELFRSPSNNLKSLSGDDASSISEELHKACCQIEIRVFHPCKSKKTRKKRKEQEYLVRELRNDGKIMISGCTCKLK